MAVGCARGTVAVIGGPEVYSYFLQIGYDDFYLSRAENVYLPGGEAALRARPAGPEAGGGSCCGRAQAGTDPTT